MGIIEGDEEPRETEKIVIANNDKLEKSLDKHWSKNKKLWAITTGIGVVLFLIGFFRESLLQLLP